MKEIKVNADETVEITETKTEVKQETSDLNHLKLLLEQKKFDKEKTLAERQKLVDDYGDVETRFDEEIAAMEKEIAEVELEVATLNGFESFEAYNKDKAEKAALLAEMPVEELVETPVEEVIEP